LIGLFGLALAACDDTTPADPSPIPSIDGGSDALPPDIGDPDMAPAPLDPPGAQCSGPDDCASGLCLSTPDGGRCTVPCDADPEVCPEGWYCGQNVALGGGVCQPTLGLCDPCTEDASCGGSADRCLPLGGQGGALHCARDCSIDACPAGFGCRAIGLGRQCLPVDDICPDVVEEDDDRDGVSDDEDNCPAEANPDQSDGDEDGFGDACDPCPAEAGPGGCPGGGPGFLGGQFISAGGEMAVGDFRLRLTLGAREPIHRMRTPNLRLRPISLGRTP